MPTLELGEFKEGLAKGFKFWWPKTEVCEIGLGDGWTLTHQRNLAYILNLGVKQKYADQIKDTKIVLKGYTAQSPEGKAYCEQLAKLYPNGVLNTQEEVLNNPPWKT